MVKDGIPKVEDESLNSHLFHPLAENRETVWHDVLVGFRVHILAYHNLVVNPQYLEENGKKAPCENAPAFIPVTGPISS